MVLIFESHQFFLYSFTTFKVNLDAISFAYVFEGFTKSFIIRNSYRVSVHRPIVWFVVVSVACTVCLGLHSVYGPMLGTCRLVMLLVSTSVPLLVTVSLNIYIWLYALMS